MLTAGLGTRLWPLTAVRAKPAIPVAGEPIVRRIIRWLVDQGVPNVALNLHHLPHTLTSLVGDGSDLGAVVRYSWEQPAILGSAGGPRHALDIIGTDSFFLVNGDTLTDACLEALWSSHAASRALVTMALTPNVEPQKYGGVTMRADGTIDGFVARGPAAEGSFHFIGVQAVSRQAFAHLPPGVAINSVGGLYDRLIAERPGSVRGFVTRAAFWDIGTVADYWRTSMVFASDASARGTTTILAAATARVSSSILWDGVLVGDGAILDECIVTDDVPVPAGARYRRAILILGADGQVMAIPFEAD